MLWYHRMEDGPQKIRARAPMHMEKAQLGSVIETRIAGSGMIGWGTPTASVGHQDLHFPAAMSGRLAGHEIEPSSARISGTISDSALLCGVGLAEFSAQSGLSLETSNALQITFTTLH